MSRLPDAAFAAVLPPFRQLPACCGQSGLWVGAILPVLESPGTSSFQLISQGDSGQECAMVRSHRYLCFWLKEEKHQTEQHPPETTGCPYFCARGSPATHRGCHCPVILIQRPLPSWPDHVTVLLAVRTCWVWFGAILPVLESVGSSSSQMSGRGQRGHNFALLWPHRCVCLAEREEAQNKAAPPCDHGQPLPLSSRVSINSPRLSMSHRPH